MRHLICKLLDISERSYYTFKKQKRPIILLLEKYFKKEDLQEFLETKKIEKFEKADFIQKEVFELNSIKYFQSFASSSLSSTEYKFIIFYFNFLSELNKSNQNKETINSFVFNKFFYVVDFNHLLNTFLVSKCIDNLTTKKETINNIYIINKYFYIFKEWDSYMLLFLKECLNNQFKNLYNPNDCIENKKEAFYHICGFIVFTDKKYEKLTDVKKIDYINNKYKEYKKLPLSSDSINIILDNLSI